MRNKTKVFLAILSMALSFALSFACTVYASPLVAHDRQTAAVANEPETAPAPERSAESVIQDVDSGPIMESAFEPLCDDGTCLGPQGLAASDLAGTLCAGYTHDIHNPDTCLLYTSRCV